MNANFRKQIRWLLETEVVLTKKKQKNYDIAASNPSIEYSNPYDFGTRNFLILSRVVIFYLLLFPKSHEIDFKIELLCIDDIYVNCTLLQCRCIRFCASLLSATIVFSDSFLRHTAVK